MFEYKIRLRIGVTSIQGKNLNVVKIVQVFKCTVLLSLHDILFHCFFQVIGKPKC